VVEVVGVTSELLESLDEVTGTVGAVVLGGDWGRLGVGGSGLPVDIGGLFQVVGSL